MIEFDIPANQFARMPAFWGCMNKRYWRAAHDGMQQIAPVPLGRILPFRRTK